MAEEQPHELHDPGCEKPTLERYICSKPHRPPLKSTLDKPTPTERYEQTSKPCDDTRQDRENPKPMRNAEIEEKSGKGLL
jgi:hypothetical protein